MNYGTLLVILVAIILQGCGDAGASAQASAQVIPAPLAGYTCFAIVNSGGEAVGGSCVKD